MKGVYVFLADGFEDVEALATLDVLRRGAVDAKLVSVTDEPFVVSSHNVAVGVDLTFDELLASASQTGTDETDVMVFPGGMPGTRNLAGHEELMALMQKHYAEGGTVAAICAAPGLVAGQLPGLEGKRFTCFDGFEELPASKGAVYVDAPAVTDGRLITGRSAGHAIAFGLAILTKLKGEQAAQDVKAALMRTC